MREKYLYPKNKDHFKKLIPLAKKILSICKHIKANPVIYGSFAHFYHTKDEKFKVNDIDILILDKYIPVLAEELKIHKIKFRLYPPGILVREGKLKVEIDKMDKEYEKRNHPFFLKTSNINFYGIDTNTISLKQLEEMYLGADIQTKKNKLKIGKKTKHLERFLGRKLK